MYDVGFRNPGYEHYWVVDFPMHEWRGRSWNRDWILLHNWLRCFHIARESIELIPKKEHPQPYHDYTRHPEHPKNKWWKNASLNFSINFAYLQMQLICFHQGISKLKYSGIGRRMA